MYFHGRMRASGKSVPPTPVDRSTAAGPLTEREREVVALIVRSSTNRKIAERAGDRRGRPCPNILNKLNLHSRAQVAVWTMEQARSVP
jgi:DNA-binding CsgD family transcriptional regulator